MHKKLKKGIGVAKKSGRSNSGRISVWSKGGGHKKRIKRVVGLIKESGVYKVREVLYDSGRSSDVVLMESVGGKGVLVVGTKGMVEGKEYRVHESLGERGYIGEGEEGRLKDVRVGSWVHNVNGKVGRSGGIGVRYISNEGGRCKVRYSSGKEEWISEEIRVRVGRVSEEKNKREASIRKKAGRSRWQGKRPVVRGVAMNPVDHPHGGGEGKSSGKRVSPWGKAIGSPKPANSRRQFGTVALCSRLPWQSANDRICIMGIVLSSII